MIRLNGSWKMSLQFLRKWRTWTNITRCIVMLMSLMAYCWRIIQHCWVVLTTKFTMWQLVGMTMWICMIQTVGMIKAVRSWQHIPTTFDGFGYVSIWLFCLPYRTHTHDFTFSIWYLIWNFQFCFACIYLLSIIFGQK